MGDTMNEEPLVSISEAARQIGLNKSTLSRQIQAKRIRSHGGKVRISEVRADRSASIAMPVTSSTRSALLYIEAHLQRHETLFDRLVDAVDPLLGSPTQDKYSPAFCLALRLLTHCMGS